MLLLVYDYMPNGSLDSHIFCGPEKQALEWSHRYKIVSGVAFALHYLHNEYDQKVLHRDLKASNIMLDSDFNARLSDFGLARAIDNEKTSYAELEGRPWTRAGYGGFQFLMDWVWFLHRDGRILEAVDERLGGEYVVEEARRLLLLGLACSHPTAAERPTTLTIARVLLGSADAPCVPPFKPAFIWPLASPPTEDGDTADATPTTSLLFQTGWTPRYANKKSDTGCRDSSPA
ncbi:hypothetical protein NL676_014621 [Syzygium grande]|nr:hypothetical protein NL676_014621 [Syzygium grande]